MLSAIVIVQSIAKVWMCFQNEAPVSEHVFECILEQHVFKMHWNLKMHSKTCSKPGASFQNTLQGLTHSYNNRVSPGRPKLNKYITHI